tara:strand:+ start:30988 stop:32142 length:1155 start_codon:yes stop_codon:yes gene_type:complete
MNDRLLRKWVQVLLMESKASDAFEAEVAGAINNAGREIFKASAAGGDVRYPDVLVEVPGVGSTYVEVKMGHKDNLANPRIYYDGSTWASNATSPVADAAVDLANNSSTASQFIDDLKVYMGVSPDTIIKIPTTKGGLKDPAAVPLEVMRNFVNERGSRYFVNEENVDVGNLITQHYLIGKAAAAHYLQAGDDFYTIGDQDPLGLKGALEFCGLNSSIPMVAGSGNFKIRVSTRSQFYEIQPELKITTFNPPNSSFSALAGESMEGAGKINPFACLYQFLSSTSSPEISEIKDIIGALVRESLLFEELTKTDKKEIEKIARKQAKKEIDKVVGTNFVKTIQDEVKKILKDKATKQEIGDISKAVMKKLYKDLAMSSPQIIDRIKV